MVCTLTGRNESFEYFVVISIGDKSTNHGKLLSTFVVTITLTVLTSISVEVFCLSALYKEKNKLRHHHVISISCTLTEYSSRETSARISLSYGRNNYFKC